MTTFLFGVFWVLIGFRAIAFPNFDSEIKILGSPALGLVDFIGQSEQVVRGVPLEIGFPLKF